MSAWNVWAYNGNGPAAGWLGPVPLRGAEFSKLLCGLVVGQTLFFVRMMPSDGDVASVTGVADGGFLSGSCRAWYVENGQWAEWNGKGTDWIAHFIYDMEDSGAQYEGRPAQPIPGPFLLQCTRSSVT